ncbi:MAG: hypothetical protein K8F91_18470 [Candidatus Obscuribacterales bacterium]|nr:hypothetical protein [Candidatus Obscuribacterales bacterium]
MNFDNILITELAFVAFVLLGLGFVKMPKFLMRKQLSRHFPWGYYPDQVPRGDPGYFPEHNTDFLHDVGTEFGGMDTLGDYGEFSGFGELGEFGSSFFGGGE